MLCEGMEWGRQDRPPENGEYRLSFLFRWCMCALTEKKKQETQGKRRCKLIPPPPPGEVSLHHHQEVSWPTGIGAAVLLISQQRHTSVCSRKGKGSRLPAQVPSLMDQVLLLQIPASILQELEAFPRSCSWEGEAQGL